MRSLVIDLRGNPGRAVGDVRRSGRAVRRSGRDRFHPRPHRPGGLHLYGPRAAGVADAAGGASSTRTAPARRRSSPAPSAITTAARWWACGASARGPCRASSPGRRRTAGLRLTTAKFYSPNGQPYSRVGVEPDVVVRQAARPIEGTAIAAASRDDAVLHAALNVARNRSQQR